MLKIEKTKYAGQYKIEVLFNNGKHGVADLEETILNDKRPIFSRLRDEAVFGTFKQSHGTVVWFNELDLAPEYLFYITFRGNPDYRELFRTWGYI